MEIARNLVSFLVPCHGVVCSHGQALAYSGGEGIEERLLEVVGVDVTDLPLTPAVAR